MPATPATPGAAGSGAPAPPAAPSLATRIRAPDAARGLAMVVMIVGHASTFAKVDVAAEVYADRRLPLPGLGFMLPGFFVNLAPVLFWFLVGTSVALVTGRRASEREVDRFMLVRAAILIAVDQVLIPFLWSPTQPFRVTLIFELLTALGLALVLLVPLRRAPDAALLALAAVLALGYPQVIHHVPQARLERLPVWLRALVTYDFDHEPQITFPLAGWFVLPLLGLVAGRRLRDPAWRAPRPWLLLALASLAVGLASRLTGYGDYSPWRPADGPLRWFVLCKGPPGLDFLGLYLGVGLLATAALFSPRLDWSAAWARWLVLMGQVALFLFTVHLGICWLVARPLLHVLHAHDALRYALTCAGSLAVLTALAAGYRGLKARHPRSVLRFL